MGHMYIYVHTYIGFIGFRVWVFLGSAFEGQALAFPTKLMTTKFMILATNQLLL